MRWATWLAWGVVIGMGGTQSALAETTAEWRSRIATEYDKKIDEARNPGKDKAVEVYMRHKTGFLENCNKLDVNTKNQVIANF